MGGTSCVLAVFFDLEVLNGNLEFGVSPLVASESFIVIIASQTSPRRSNNGAGVYSFIYWLWYMAFSADKWYLTYLHK